MECSLDDGQRKATNTIPVKGSQDTSKYPISVVNVSHTLNNLFKSPDVRPLQHGLVNMPKGR